MRTNFNSASSLDQEIDNKKKNLNRTIKYCLNAEKNSFGLSNKKLFQKLQLKYFVLSYLK